MSLRHVVIVGVSVLALAIAIGLSCNGSGKCDPGSCASGCCDDDLCRPGVDELACGINGASCVSCASGEVCQSGACTPLGSAQNQGVQDAGGVRNPGPYSDAGWECMSLGYCPRLGSDECGEPCGVGCCVPYDQLGRCSVSLLSTLCGAHGQLCAPCAANERCTQTNGGGECVVSSGTGGGAGGGSVESDAGNGSLPVGSPCTAGVQCAGGVCEQGGNVTGGYCTANCTHPLTCPAGSSCSAFFGSSPNPECVANCSNPGTGQDSCRPGYVCDVGWVSNSAQAACVPACGGSNDCGGAQCEQGYCCGLARLKCCASGAACSAGSGCGNDGYCH